MNGGSANANGMGIRFENARNNVVSGLTINNNTGFGIYLNQSDDNTLTSNTVASNGYGIGLDNSSRNNLTGNSAPYNYFGIGLYSGSEQNNLTRNSANSNTIGVYLNDAEQNNLNGTTTNSNSIGIYATSSNATNISGGLLEGNGWGIYLENSDGGNLSGNSFFNNQVGIALDHADSYVLFHNRVNNSGSFGLNIVSSTSNLIYDNYLFNDYNVNPDASGGNTWNISKTYSREGNIIGGAYLGGNFYGNPDGYGFSQTTNSTDGIADYPLNITPGNQDQLPLALYPPGPSRPPAPTPEPPPVPPPEPWVVPDLETPDTPLSPSDGPAIVVSKTIPSSAEPGETINMAITIANNEEISWEPGDYVTMQVWMTDSNGVVVSQVINVAVSDGKTIKPGQNHQFSFNLQMPQQTGNDQLNIQLWKYVNGKWVRIGSTIKSAITVGGEESKAGHRAGVNTATSWIPRSIIPDNTSGVVASRIPANFIEGKPGSLNVEPVVEDLPQQAIRYTTTRMNSTPGFVYNLDKNQNTAEYYSHGNLTTILQKQPDRGNVSLG